MDKSFETYEFLPASTSTLNETDQFFVVQDDGTFIINKQNIQYITEVHDIEDIPQDVPASSIYDVTAQQFYVGNSTELLVPEQFTVPDEENTLTNSYLIQPELSAGPGDEAIVIDTFEQQNSQDFGTEVASYNENLGDDCTEITLSDEQYKCLEQKGWVLLQFNEKTYMLNELGLHDVTADNVLVDKLKCELQNASNVVNDPSQLKNGDIKIEELNNILPAVAAIDDGIPETKCSENPSDIYTCQPLNEDTIPKVQSAQESNKRKVVKRKKTIYPKKSPVTYVKMLPATPNIKLKDENYILKIKTAHNFKDIPEKILLGNTVNGKKLYAKVVKSKQKFTSTNLNGKEDTIQTETEAKIIYDNSSYQVLPANKKMMTEQELATLIQQSMQDSVLNSSAEDLASVKTVLAQLLKVNNLKNSIVERDLVLTKVTEKMYDESGLRPRMFNNSRTILVTGRVRVLGDNQGEFIHLPDMFKNIFTEQENKIQAENGGPKPTKETKHKIVHIHILENKSPDNTLKVSVNITKMNFFQIPLTSSSNVMSNALYACGSCASLFETDQMLKEHQEYNCNSENDDIKLTIDTDNSSSEKYIVSEEGNLKYYTCKQCNANFTKEYNCVQHVKTHIYPNTNPAFTENYSGKTDKDGVEIFSCKMCHCSFFHQSTLTKHILKMHIRMHQIQ